jgi:phosphosulfolactate phosphohydrolase-like enzyme
VVLLCAGTDGRAALEDVIGAGAILHALQQRQALADLSDLEEMAVRTFRTERQRLAEVLAETRGGQNVRAAGLEADIAFAAQVDVMQTVGVVDMTSPERPIITALPPAPAGDQG